MKIETAAMKHVVDCYFSESPPLTGLSGAIPEELVRRLGILRYGYEARVRSALEQACGFLKSQWSQQKWLEAGKSFSYQQAFREEQLGLLPLSFFEFVKAMELSQDEKTALEKDRAVFQSQHSVFKEPFQQKDFQYLHEKSMLSLQDTVVWVNTSEGAWVVSRNRERFFEAEVSQPVRQLLEKVQRKNISVEDFMASVQEDRLLADFLVSAVSYHWLKKPL